MSIVIRTGRSFALAEAVLINHHNLTGFHILAQNLASCLLRLAACVVLVTSACELWLNMSPCLQF